MIGMLIYVLILLAIAAVVWWGISQLGLPPPVKVVAVVVLAIFCLLALLYLLRGIAAGPPF